MSPSLSTNAVYQRRRAPLPDELTHIPWLGVLTEGERRQVVPQLVVSDPQTGDYVCRIGRPVTFWFGVVSGLLKMSSDNEQGQTMTFTGVPPGGWFGEGTVLKREAYRYNIQALRPSVVAGLPIDTLLAYLAGLSRQRVNGALRRLEQQQLIQIEYGGLRILDMEGLRRSLFEQSGDNR